MHRSVDGGPFRRLAPRATAGVDIGYPQATSEYRRHVTLATRQLARAQHVLGDARIAREILVDELLRGAALDAELRREPEGAHAVDQAEIHCLDIAALIGRDVVNGHAENLRGGRPVNIRTLVECSGQRCVAGEMRHDAQLDLRIVGREERVPWSRDALADARAAHNGYDQAYAVVRHALGTRRNRFGETCRGVIECRHHGPTGCRVDHLRELVGISRFELR